MYLPKIVTPRIIDQRIKNQQGLFMLVPFIFDNKGVGTESLITKTQRLINTLLYTRRDVHTGKDKAIVFTIPCCMKEERVRRSQAPSPLVCKIYYKLCIYINYFSAPSYYRQLDRAISSLWLMILAGRCTMIYSIQNLYTMHWLQSQIFGRNWYGKANSNLYDQGWTERLSITGNLAAVQNQKELANYWAGILSGNHVWNVRGASV